jgi:hypothetical protein
MNEQNARGHIPQPFVWDDGYVTAVNVARNPSCQEIERLCQMLKTLVLPAVEEVAQND